MESENAIIFTRVYDGTTVSLKTHADSTLDEVCQAFEDFLRGCGYVFDGKITIDHGEIA